MNLVCAACGDQREISDDVIEQLGADTMDRVPCPACGQLAARVQPPEDLHPPGVPPLQDLGSVDDQGWAGRPLRLRRGDREYRLRDLDRLRRLVVERKAGGSDLVSTDGVRWVPVTSIAALAPYLAVVRFLDSAPVTGGGGMLVEATAAVDGWDDGDPAYESSGEDPPVADAGIEDEKNHPTSRFEEESS